MACRLATLLATSAEQLRGQVARKSLNRLNHDPHCAPPLY